MKTVTVLCLIAYMLTGCTTLHPITNVPSDLSGHFGDGGVLQPGDRVVITTVTGAKHELRITSVRDGVIVGDRDSVPFSEIASVERRDSSPGKTTALVASIVVIVGFVAAGIHAGSHPNTQL